MFYSQLPSIVPVMNSIAGTRNPATVESLESRRLLSSTVVGITASDSIATETNGGTAAGRGQYIVTRTGSTASALVVHYQLRSGSTASTADYQPLPGTVTILAGKTRASFDLKPIDDTLGEGPETAIMSLIPENTYAVDPKAKAATVTIEDNDRTDWYDSKWHYNAGISFNVGSYARTDEIVSRGVNMTQLLTAMGKSGSVLDPSLKVVETNSTGTKVLDSNVVFQFDKSQTYNPATNASGTLLIQMKGTTAANVTRYYHLYFDTTGSFVAPTFTSQVDVDASSTDEGQDAFKITTAVATYYLQKENGGFSSIIDKDGNDWLSFNDTSGSGGAGEYRGTPNIGIQGIAHAGFATSTVTLVSSGPLRATFIVDGVEAAGGTGSDKDTPATNPKTATLRYDISPTNVQATVEQASSNYWFLYEGTPGGSVGTEDKVVRSDGTVTDIGTAFDVDNGIGAGTNDGEWAYFEDTNLNRYFYMVHNTSDTIVDSYYNLNNQMTVFGFGRSGLDEGQQIELTTPNNVFTFGIGDNDAFTSAKTLINGQYRPMTASGVHGEKLS